MKKHKRYIGNLLITWCAVCAVLFTILPVACIPFILKYEVSASTVFLSVAAAFMSLVFARLLYTEAPKLLCWFEFAEQYVIVKPLFHKSYTLEYSKCTDVGLGLYVHGFTSHTVGLRADFIYLSYNKLAEKYKANINMLKPSKTCIKISYRKKTYDFLMETMPKNQANMLRVAQMSLNKQRVKTH